MPNDYLESLRNHFQEILVVYLSSLKNIPDRLANAIKYSTLQNGKRLRPLLVYNTGLIFNCDIATLDNAACAIELVHIFSLIHDDLPGMDNDDWRRGQPTCHKQFDEATAILAGDALLSMAGTLLCTNKKLTATQRLTMLQTLLEATGPEGMIGGQMLDIQLTQNTLKSPQKPIFLQELEHIYLGKTAALFRASVKLGAIAANCQQKTILQNLDDYAKFLGLAFQIQDDLADTNAENNKTQYNYVTLTNLTHAKQSVQNFYQQSLTALQKIPYDTALLKNLASHMIAINN
jgi:farnesyl diphosphate synthase